MQLSGIGSNHTSDMHYVTNCLHDHGKTEKKGGAAAAPQEPASLEQLLAQQKEEPAFSLNTWIQNLLGRARGIWGNIWGSTEGAPGTQTPDSAGTQTLVTPMSVEDAQSLVTPMSVAVASEAVSPPVNNLTNNPYFSAIEDTGRQQETLWQKVKVRFDNISGYLTKHFSFSNRNSFQTKQERPKEDLSRRSRYRKDDLEIDCMLTDESYLMDSYNKKGEYSTLSAANSTEHRQN